MLKKGKVFYNLVSKPKGGQKKLVPLSPTKHLEPFSKKRARSFLEITAA